jgi:hypothetical protein
MMEAVRTSETSVKFNVITQRTFPEDSKLKVPIVSQIWVQLSHKNGVVSMVTKLGIS